MGATMMHDHPPAEIVESSSTEHIDHARKLFREYWEWFGFEPCFQGFETELAGLPGAYAPPQGCVLLAYCGAKPAGCVALRSLGPGICEMKRLWVRPQFRGLRIGIGLTRAVIETAKARGYGRMRLDTLPQMTEALALYGRFGFEKTVPYTDTPGAIHLELEL
jgi:carbonic anhydrase